MSIATRIESIEEHIEQAYDELQGLGADLTGIDKNIENISMVLDDIYDSMPQVSGEGTSLTLDDTRIGKIKSTLKGNTSQTTYSGINLFKEIPTQTVNGITITNNGDGSYTLNGTSTAWTGIRILLENELPVDTYTLSATYNKKESNAYVSLRTSNLTSIGNINCNQDGLLSLNRFDITSDKKIGAVEISVGNPNVTISNFIVKPFLVKGSYTGSTLPDFEPYVGGTASPNPSYPQPVNVVSGDNEIVVCRKNLFTLGNRGAETVNGATSVLNGSEFSLKGTYTSTGNPLRDSGNHQQLYIGFFKAGTYHITSSVKGGSFTPPSDGAYNTYIRNAQNGSSSSQILQGGFNTSQTFTLTNDTPLYYHIYINKEGYVFNDLVVNIQIEKGTSSTDYEPYQGNTYNIDLPEGMELCKIGNYQDYFYKDSDKWYLHKEIGKYLINHSTTNMFSFSQQDGYSRVMIAKSSFGMKSGVWSANVLLLTHFVQYSSGTTTSGMFQTNANGNNVYFYIPSSITSLDNAITYMGDLNCIAYAVQNTPTNTEITYTPLIEQLNAIEQAQSKENQTNISQVNNDLPFIISASALKEWQESASLNSTLSMVNPLSLGNTLNTQENNTQPIEVDNIEPLEEEENE